MPELISPDEMFDRAKAMMLDGRDPASEDDWVRIVEFIAYNTPIEVAIPVVHIMALIYEIPLSEKVLSSIATYQSIARVLIEAETEIEKQRRRMN